MKRSGRSASREQYAKLKKVIKECFTGKMVFHKRQSEGREGPKQALGGKAESFMLSEQWVQRQPGVA